MIAIFGALDGSWWRSSNVMYGASALHSLTRSMNSSMLLPSAPESYRITPQIFPLHLHHLHCRCSRYFVGITISEGELYEVVRSVIYSCRKYWWAALFAVLAFCVFATVVVDVSVIVVPYQSPDTVVAGSGNPPHSGFNRRKLGKIRDSKFKSIKNYVVKLFL